MPGHRRIAPEPRALLGAHHHLPTSKRVPAGPCILADDGRRQVKNTSSREAVTAPLEAGRLDGRHAHPGQAAEDASYVPTRRQDGDHRRPACERTAATSPAPAGYQQMFEWRGHPYRAQLQRPSQLQARLPSRAVALLFQQSEKHIEPGSDRNVAQA